jgi:hypothetical protein
LFNSVLHVPLITFPSYFFAVFILPLFYGAWRLALFHFLVGPVTARMLTTNSSEMPAIWCLFSIGIIVIALTPRIRYGVFGALRPCGTT